MDANQLSTILDRFTKSNQEFMNKIAQDQKTFMETALKGSVPQTNQVAAIPTFREFDRARDNWPTYLLQLEQHFEANGVALDTTKRACLLSWIGSFTLELLQKLFGDEKLNEKTFKELSTKLGEHYISKQHVLAARCKFYKTMMKEGQTYAEWVADLRGAARECSFACQKTGCNEKYTDFQIRDMLVIHTPHDAVRSNALQKTNPTLEEVLEIARLFETTARSTKEIKGESPVLVHQIQNRGQHSQRSSKRRGRHIRSRHKPVSNKRKAKSCPGCGQSHERSDCFHYRNKTTCNSCGIQGHISTVCMSAQSATARSKSSQRPSSNLNFNGRGESSVNSIHSFHEILSVDVDNAPYPDPIETVHTLASSSSSDKIVVDVSINNCSLPFQVDTGASCSMVGLFGYQQLGKPAYQMTNKILKAYGGVSVPVLGNIDVDVQWDNSRLHLPLLVINSVRASNILGMDWFRALNFEVKFPKNLFVHNSTVNFSVLGQASHQQLLDRTQKLCDDNLEIFSPCLGLCSSFKAEITLKPNARPKFHKPYNLPFAQTDGVRDEINRLVSIGVLKPIKFSEWAAPIVAVQKPNGTIRICADFKVTVNPQIEIDRYPIPRIEELFHKLQGGTFFTKIDLTDAYLQIELAEESKKFLVINTPFGLFQFQRLPFGVASAPGIFQRFMEEVVAGVPNCAVYLDDIIVTGKTNDEHIDNLNEIFSRFTRNGLRCKREKCRFGAESIEYLGHVISSAGIQPSEKRLDAIKLMPRPTNVKEVEAFIGKINYYNKFVPNFSTKAAPLNELRRKDVKFTWAKRQEDSFQCLKDAIVNASRLAHLRDDFPLILATDASKCGIGAVISHRYPDGTEHPIAFASKTLNSSQVGYSQIEKEALSIIYGVTKFHQFLYGRMFELQTDHQPLTTLFHPSKKLPVMTLHRLQRWAIVLQAYTYTIRFKPTAHHANADALSRLPVGDDVEFDELEKKLINVDHVYQAVVDDFPINATTIAKFTEEDPILRAVSQYVLNGWPATVDGKLSGDIKSYMLRNLSFSFQNGVLLLHAEHTRVVIPTALRSQVIQMLHEGHWGSTRMKQMARRYCWFPGIDAAIVKLCATCTICTESASNPTREFSSWPPPSEPWERVHIDYAGPFFSRMWLIVVDAFSKFPYTIEQTSSTSATTICALQKILAVEGLPSTIVTDNGTQFTSSEFEQFCHLNSIQHLTTAPFHPSSNGVAERAVRTFKQSFSKIMEEENNRDLAIFKYLSTYRFTPDPSTGKSPAELLHGRQPRNLLSVMLPDYHPKPLEGETKFVVDQSVFTRVFSGRQKWIPGTIKKVVGRKMYEVKTQRGTLRRNQNQLRKRVVTPDVNINIDHQTDDNPVIVDDMTNDDSNHNSIQPLLSQGQSDVTDETTNDDSSNNQPNTSPVVQQPTEDGSSELFSTPLVRRSDRPRRPVVRFNSQS